MDLASSDITVHLAVWGMVCEAEQVFQLARQTDSNQKAFIITLKVLKS